MKKKQEQRLFPLLTRFFTAVVGGMIVGLLTALYFALNPKDVLVQYFGLCVAGMAIAGFWVSLLLTFLFERIEKR